MKRIVHLLALIFIACLFLTSCGDKSTTEAQPLKIGYLAIAGSLPFFVAEDNGFFQKQALSVEFIEFKSSNEIAVAAASGRIDVVGLGAVNAMLDAMQTSGRQFEAFLSIGYLTKDKNNHSTDSLIVRNDINSIDELKGKRVAFFPGSISKVFAKIVLEQQGVALNDIRYIEMSPANWLPSLQSGSIDAVTAVEPFATMIVNSGYGKILLDGYYSSVFEEIPLSSAWFTNESINDATKQKFVTAIQDAINLIDSNPTLALQSFESYTRMSPDIYQHIGLNTWELTTENSARSNLDKYYQLLINNQQIRYNRGSEWIWQPKG